MYTTMLNRFGEAYKNIPRPYKITKNNTDNDIEDILQKSFNDILDRINQLHTNKKELKKELKILKEELKISAEYRFNKAIDSSKFCDKKILDNFLIREYVYMRSIEHLCKLKYLSKEDIK